MTFIIVLVVVHLLLFFFGAIHSSKRDQLQENIAFSTWIEEVKRS